MSFSWSFTNKSKKGCSRCLVSCKTIVIPDFDGFQLIIVIQIFRKGIAEGCSIDVTDSVDPFTVDRPNIFRKTSGISAQTDKPFRRYTCYKYRGSNTFKTFVTQYFFSNDKGYNRNVFITYTTDDRLSFHQIISP